MKKYCIIFDTNILINNKRILNDIKAKLELMADIYIPEIVIEEIKSQNSRIIEEDYLKIKAIIEKNLEEFKYEENFDLDTVIKKRESKIERWLKAFCNENIIYYKDNISINEILIRLKYKKAPFINEKGSSDKGFKDTILWLSILKTSKMQDYKKIFLITNDKIGFAKRAEDLYKEFKQEHSGSLVICSTIEELYENIGIIKSSKNKLENLEDSTNKVNDFDELKEKLNACTTNILYTIYEDQWGNETSIKTFNIYKKMEEEDIESFLFLLDDFLKENIFFDMIDITDLLIRCGIESAGENVSSKYLNQLNDIYKSLKDDKNLYNPFINFLKIEFNKLYTSRLKEKEDPFANFDSTDFPF